MVIRGRLAFNDDNELVEIAADAEDPNNPSPSEIEPVSLQDVLLSGVLDGQGTAELQDLARVAADTGEYQSVNTEELSNVYDYIVHPGDSVNDIINTQLSAGESVWIGQGTHTVTKSQAHALDITAANATIAGSGTLKLEDNATSHTSNSDDEAVIGISADGVTVRDITVDGNKANNTTSDLDDFTGIRPNSADDYHIENVEVRNCTNGGIKNASSTGVGGTIDNNHIHDNDKDQVFIDDAEVTGEGNLVESSPNQDGIEPVGEKQTWRGNIVKNVTGSAFDVFGAKDVTVADNIIIVGDNGPTVGVSFNGVGSEPTEGCVATGNVMVGSHVTGAADNSEKLLEVGEQRGCKAVGNVEHGTTSPIQLDTAEFKFAENEVYDKQGIAVQVSGGGEDVEISDNYFLAGSAAAHVQLASGTSGTTVRNNRSVDAPGDAIDIAGSTTEHEVIDNTFINPSLRGVAAKNGGSGLLLRGNTVRGAGGDAFDIINQDEVTVVNNTVHDASQWAYWFEEKDGATHTGLIVRGNESDGSGGGMKIYEGTGQITDVELIDNRLINNGGTVVDDQSTGTKHVRNTDSIPDHKPLESSVPSSPEAGDWYIDDGTNTSSGNLAIRIYDGTAWVDQN